MEQKGEIQRNSFSLKSQLDHNGSFKGAWTLGLDPWSSIGEERGELKMPGNQICPDRVRQPLVTSSSPAVLASQKPAHFTLNCKLPLIVDFAFSFLLSPSWGTSLSVLFWKWKIPKCHFRGLAKHSVLGPNSRDEWVQRACMDKRKDRRYTFKFEKEKASHKHACVCVC